MSVLVLKYRKRHFPGLYCLEKKLCKKCQFLDPNDGLTTLKKYQFLDFITLLFFSLERAFFYSRISWKTFSLPISPKKKSLEKWPFSYQNDGLTPLEKGQFFDFWTSCYYSLERLFFVLQYPERNFPGLYCLKKKFGKMAIFGLKPWLNPLGKMSSFRLFKLVVFIA